MSENLVYFVLAPDANLVKIGKSNDVNKRLNTLQTGSAEPLSLILSLPNRPPLEEWQLHRRFSQYRQHGEWFEYRADLKDFIEEKQKNPIATPYDDESADNQFFPQDGRAGETLARCNRVFDNRQTYPKIQGYPSSWLWKVGPEW